MGVRRSVGDRTVLTTVVRTATAVHIGAICGAACGAGLDRGCPCERLSLCWKGPASSRHQRLTSIYCALRVARRERDSHRRHMLSLRTNATPESPIRILIAEAPRRVQLHAFGFTYHSCQIHPAPIRPIPAFLCDAPPLRAVAEGGPVGPVPFGRRRVPEPTRQRDPPVREGPPRNPHAVERQLVRLDEAGTAEDPVELLALHVEVLDEQHLCMRMHQARAKHMRGCASCACAWGACSRTRRAARRRSAAPTACPRAPRSRAPPRRATCAHGDARECRGCRTCERCHS